jgi:DNA-binding NarL/FixJ family response regulator
MIREGKHMVTLSAYSAAPITGIGLRAILETEEDLRVSYYTSSLDDLEARLRENPPNLLLLDLNYLKRIAAIDSRTALILWFDNISAEYLTQAMALGALGFSVGVLRSRLISTASGRWPPDTRGSIARLTRRSTRPIELP